MDTRIIDEVVNQIQKRFPEMAGVRPKVQVRRSSQANDTYLLIFQNHVRVAGGQSLTRAVRVVVNNDGKILKISTSR